MAHVIPGGEIAELRSARIIGGGPKPQYRLILDADENEVLRANPVEYLASLGIRSSTNDASATVLQADGGLDPIPGTNCYETTCYDVYCCPLVLVPFKCIVCDESSASLARFAAGTAQTSGRGTST
jgi:hypothetical protein